jgi:CRISPR-associated exonuclease Cas4
MNSVKSNHLNDVLAEPGGKTVFQEADLLPLSGLQHLLYCPRRFALVHIEQIWQENRYTAEGSLQHEKVHAAGCETREGIKIVRNLALRSIQLGLVGKADVVEFHGTVPFPVEHKRGRDKTNNCDRVQLCAQALCLEEMLGIPIPEGAIFYGQPRRRTSVLFDTALREETIMAAAGMHALFKEGYTPSAQYVREKCDPCSLFHLCKPRAIRSVVAYLETAIR